MVIKNKKRTLKHCSKVRSKIRSKICSKRHPKCHSKVRSKRRSKRRSKVRSKRRSKVRSKRRSKVLSKRKAKKIRKSKVNKRKYNANSESTDLLTNMLHNPDIKDLQNVFVKGLEIQKYDKNFSNIIQPLPDITNQKSSGRCWIFAFLNTLRPKFIQKYKLPKSFQFSANYLYFYHKLERAFYFLDKITKYFEDNRTNSTYYEDRLYQYLLSDPISDGGRSNMLLKLVSTYGIVPEKIFRNTPTSEKTQQFDNLIKQNLISYSEKIRKMITNDEENITQQLEIFKQEIREFLEKFLGKPPEKNQKLRYTDYQTKDKTKKFLELERTPLEFLKLVGFNQNDYITCVNYPSLDFNKYYNIKLCENDTDFPTECLNLPINTLIETVKKSIDSNEPVWFACDIIMYHYKPQGILDHNLFDMQSISQFDKNIKTLSDYEKFKADLTRNKLSGAKHAMTFVGYDLGQNGEITKFMVENSWGKFKKQENKGYLTMSVEWFRLFVFEIFTKEMYVNETTKLPSNIEPELVNPWGLMSCSFMKK